MQDKKKKLNDILTNDILFTDDNHVTDHAPSPLINHHRNAFFHLKWQKEKKKKKKNSVALFVKYIKSSAN